MEIEFNNISSGISKKGGIWYSEGNSEISYLEKGNDIFFQLEDNSFWFRHRNSLLKVVLEKFPAGKFILDVGGGNGFTTKFLQDSGYVCALVEPGNDGVMNANQRGIINIINSSLKDIKFKTGTVPSIGIFDVLEHIEDENTFLEEIYDCLCEDGRLYLTVPAYSFLWSHEDSIAGHFRRYSKNGLSSILKKNGFEIEFISYFFSFLLIPVFLFRTIPSIIYRILKIEKENPEVRAHKNISLLNRVVNIFLNHEERFILNKKILFGSSIIAVARKL